MKQNKKIKLMDFFRNIKRNTLLMVTSSVIFCIILIFILFNQDLSEKEIIESLILGILQSLIVFILLTLFFSLKFNKKLEDSDKLTQNYDSLSNFYKNDNVLIYKQICYNPICQRVAKKYTQNIEWCNNNIEVKFPIIFLTKINNNFIINDTHKKYEPPSFIMNHFDLLFKAHSYSNIYNNTLFRLDDFRRKENDDIEIDVGRTQYFYSLITNRAMDYKLNGNLTLRKMYVQNQSIGLLSESELSNHIGFNAIVITADDKVAFVKRCNEVSVEKNSLGLGVQASLKYKYVKEKKILKDGFYNAIYREIKDELNIEKSEIDKCDIIGMYRNLVEGGKPQLLVQYKLKISAEILSTKFSKLMKNNDKYLERDGDKVIFLNKEDILNNDVMILPDGIAGGFFEFGNKEKNKDKPKYKWFNMVPSSTASIIMWIDCRN